MWLVPICRWRARALVALACLAVLAAGRIADAAPRVDPRLVFRVTRTAHFIIYFHAGEEELASRLAPIAEAEWVAMPERLGLTPPALTHVILADQADSANGWARTLPINTILLQASVPAGDELIGRSTDWLRVLFAHEFTHVVHLDRSEGWARLARHLLGRSPIAMPNVFLPEWMIEGLAVYAESAATGEGRLGAGDFRSLETEAARAGRFPGLDRVNGGLTAWPGGEAPYAFGAGFHDFLVGRADPVSLGEVARRTAGRVPFFGGHAFQEVFGDSLGALWHEYERRVDARVTDDPREPVRRLTRRGFTAVAPRFLPADCHACAPEVLYSRQTPHEFPSLETVGLNGGEPRPLAARYGGRTVGVSGAWIVFDQQRLRRNVGLYGDLYALYRPTGRQYALTAEGRYADPDVAPDGQAVACVREHDGRRDLVVLPLRGGEATMSTAGPPRLHVGTPRVLVSEPGTTFSAPRWSPDGRRIASERHRAGYWPELVVVDVSSGEIVMVAAIGGARVVTPTWRPDGAAIVAAVDVAQGPFDLWEFTIATRGTARRLTAIPGGALWPDVSADGSQILFIGADGEGRDVYVAPYAPLSETITVDPEAASVVRTSAVRSAPSVPAAPPAESRPYRPAPTLLPTSWLPTIDDDGRRTRIGAVLSGSDVLAYHRYDAAAGWVVSAPGGESAGARPDWRFEYAYERWRPSWYATASSERRFVTRDTVTEARRRDEVEAGVIVPVLGVYASHYAGGALTYGKEQVIDAAAAGSRWTRLAARGGWALSTTHQYGCSVSHEGGLQVNVVAETAKSGFQQLQTTSVAGEVRRYAPGLAAHHVAAFRLAAGVASRAGNPDEWFYLGGSGSAPDVATLDPRPFGLLRAYPVDRFSGARMAVANVDYRWPLAWFEHGTGTWPFFVRGLQAAVFADTGHAWTTRFRVGEIKGSAGAELGTSLVLGYSVPLTVSVGAAVGRDGARPGNGTARAFYVRVGAAF